MRGSPFFEGIHQSEADVDGQSARLPVFYYDGASMNALFPARYGALRALMPGRAYVPARLAPGLGVLSVTAFEYRDCDLGAYNEVAIGVLLNAPPERANLPARALVGAQRRGRSDVFIRHLPVTTDLALRLGVDFYAFPKFVAAIDFQTDADARRCRLSAGEEHVLTLTGTRIATPHHAQVDVVSRLWMDGQPQSAQLTINQLRVGTTYRRGAARLELGARHPVALELDRLLVSRTPFWFEYVPAMEAILFGPEHLTLPLVQRGLQTMEVLR